MHWQFATREVSVAEPATRAGDAPSDLLSLPPEERQMDASSMSKRPPEEPDPAVGNGGPPGQDGGIAAAPDGFAVAAAFRTDGAVRDALTASLRPLQAESKAIAARVERAFGTFSPNALAASELERRHFVGRGEAVGDAQDRAIRAGLDARRTAQPARGITITDPEALREGGTAPDSVGLEPLLTLLERKGRGTAAVRAPSVRRASAELEAEAIVAAVEGTTAGSGAAATAAGGEAAERNGAGELVTDAVRRQMGSATSPEARLDFGSTPRLPNQADDEPAQTRILETFELRPGASDVTSFHDFHTLQIAFPHVWTRIFDGELESLGRDLYAEYVKLKDLSGSADPDLRSARSTTCAGWSARSSG